MIYKLEQLLKEVCIKTTKNNQYPVLTSSKSGIFLQEDYFTKTVASRDNTGYKVIKRGQFTYRAMSDTGDFFINCLECTDIGIVSPAYPVFEIANENILSRQYLIHFFKSVVFNKKISALSKGATRLSLKYKDLKNIEIDLPSMERQIEIAEHLDTIYGSLALLSTKNEDLDELIKTRFIEMFGDPSVNPNNYPEKELGDIAFVTKLAGFEYTKYIEYKSEGPIIMVRGLNCKKGKLVLDDVFYESRETSDSLPRSKLYKGDIVLTYVGTIGECALIDKDDAYHLAPNVAKVSLIDKNKTIPEFFVSLFVCFRDYIVSFATATSQPKISMAEIRKMSFIVPPVSEQKKFADFLKKVDECREIVKEEEIKTNELLEIKMEEYFE